MTTCGDVCASRNRRSAVRDLVDLRAPATRPRRAGTPGQWVTASRDGGMVRVLWETLGLVGARVGAVSVTRRGAPSRSTGRSRGIGTMLRVGGWFYRVVAARRAPPVDVDGAETASSGPSSKSLCWDDSVPHGALLR